MTNIIIFVFVTGRYILEKMKETQGLGLFTLPSCKLDNTHSHHSLRLSLTRGILLGHCVTHLPRQTNKMLTYFILLRGGTTSRGSEVLESKIRPPLIFNYNILNS